MKIGFLLPTVLASSKYSAGRIFAPKIAARHLIEGLLKTGRHEVTLYSAEDVDIDAPIVSGDQNLINMNPKYYQFRFRPDEEQHFATIEIIKRDFENYLTMKAYRDALKGKIDIIHSYHDFSAHYFDELTGFPTVYTIHDPLPHTANTVEYFRLSKFVNHNYISLSNAQRRGVLELNFIKTIYHGLDPADFKFSEDPDNYLIYFGRLIADKGADLAVRVAYDLKIPLHIASAPSKANQEEHFYEKKIAPLIDGDLISFQGYMTGQKLQNYIGRGKLFLFPLRWDEPFGLTLIESMACGTPVVAYANGSIPEIVKDGETGFIVNESEEKKRGDWVIKKTGLDGLIEAVKRIYDMAPDQYRKMRHACRNHVEKHFTLNTMVENYERVYEGILAKKA